MKNLLIILIVLVAAGCGGNKSEDSIDLSKLKSMNDVGDEIELLKLAQKGDTFAFDKLSISYMDYSSGEFLPIAKEMADKFNYPQAYYEVYIALLDSAGVNFREDSMNDLDKATIEFAIDYLITGAKKGSINCIHEIFNNFIKGRNNYKFLQDNEILKVHKQFIDSISIAVPPIILKQLLGKYANKEKLCIQLNDSNFPKERLNHLEYEILKDTIIIYNRDWKYKGITTYLGNEYLEIENIGLNFTLIIFNFKGPKN